MTTLFKLPVELDLSAFEENIQATFLVVNYLSKIAFGRKSVLQAWGTMSPAHYPSKRALEAGFFGRFHGQKDICDVASIWYGKSLKKLASDLNEPKAMRSTSVLRSTIVLTMYEVRLSPHIRLAPYRRCHHLRHSCTHLLD